MFGISFPLRSSRRRVLVLLPIAGFLACAGTSLAQIKLWDNPAPRPSASFAAAAIPGVRSEVTSGWSMAPLSKAAVGIAVEIPLPGGLKPVGRVNLNQKEDTGWQRAAGTIEGSKGSSFLISERNSEVRGVIEIRETSKAYVVQGRTDGTIEITEKPLHDVECLHMPLSKAAAAPAQRGPASAIQPVFSSRPDASAVLFLDFDGAIVTDSGWNGGLTINAPTSGLSDAEIETVWKSVAEDYYPFDVDVTTNPSRYNIKLPGHRMRVIITPDQSWYPEDVGGVAKIDSFAQSGTTYSSTVPCWVFNTTVKGIQEAISHELGHTLGLTHDGTITPPGGNPDDHEYYEGQGNWGPIMGASYDVDIVQWSRGEYFNANNTQDDTAIISNSTNGFGLAADDASGEMAGSDNIDAPTGTVTQPGFISTPSDGDVFHLPLDGGNLNITATPAATSPNLDIELVLLNAKGNIVTSTGNATSELTANIHQNIAAGDYYLRVRGTGFGSPATTGYSAYGSLGQYSLSGVIPGKSFPAGNLQPDLIIGKGRSRIGEGKFLSAVQDYRIEFRKQKKFKIPATITNAGLAAESFELKTSGKFSGHKYTIVTKGQDITRTLKKSGYVTPVMPPGRKQRIDIEIRPKRSLKRIKTLYLDAAATDDKARTDRISITLVPAPR